MYKLLIDYGCEGMSFYDKEFKTITEAVKEGISYTNGSKFYIVKVIDWEVSEVKEK